jgi:hypothetical protein
MVPVTTCESIVFMDPAYSYAPSYAPQVRLVRDGTDPKHARRASAPVPHLPLHSAESRRLSTSLSSTSTAASPAHYHDFTSFAAPTDHSRTVYLRPGSSKHSYSSSSSSARFSKVLCDPSLKDPPPYHTLYHVTPTNLPHDQPRSCYSRTNPPVTHPEFPLPASAYPYAFFLDECSCPPGHRPEGSWCARARPNRPVSGYMHPRRTQGHRHTHTLFPQHRSARYEHYRGKHAPVWQFWRWFGKKSRR